MGHRLLMAEACPLTTRALATEGALDRRVAARCRGGANLGPAILLVALGAMIFRAVSANRMAPALAPAPVAVADPVPSALVTSGQAATPAEPPARTDIPREQRRPRVTPLSADGHRGRPVGLHPKR